MSGGGVVTGGRVQGIVEFEWVEYVEVEWVESVE